MLPLPHPLCFTMPAPFVDESKNSWKWKKNCEGLPRSTTPETMYMFNCYFFLTFFFHKKHGKQLDWYLFVWLTFKIKCLTYLRWVILSGPSTDICMINDQETDLHLLMFLFDVIISLFFKAYKLDETNAQMAADRLLALIVQFNRVSGRGDRTVIRNFQGSIVLIAFDSIYSGQIEACFSLLQ